MKDLTIDDLRQLLLKGRQAARYALDHYEELAARKAIYTLYGPLEHGIGAARPGRLIPITQGTVLCVVRNSSVFFGNDEYFRVLG